MRPDRQNETRCRIFAINAIMAYCSVEEGPPPRRNQCERPLKDESPPVIQTKEPADLSRAIRSMKGDKRPTICFLCLGNPSLTLRKRTTSFATSGSLSRHFVRQHVSKLQGESYINCKICNVRLENRLELLVHAERLHGTISRIPAERLIP